MCEIWTDIDGMRIIMIRASVKSTRPVEQLFDEVAELALFRSQDITSCQYMACSTGAYSSKAFEYYGSTAKGTPDHQALPCQPGCVSCCCKDGSTRSISKWQDVAGLWIFRTCLQCLKKYKDTHRYDHDIRGSCIHDH